MRRGRRLPKGGCVVQGSPAASSLPSALSGFVRLPLPPGPLRYRAKPS